MEKTKKFIHPDTCNQKNYFFHSFTVFAKMPGSFPVASKILHKYEQDRAYRLHRQKVGIESFCELIVVELSMRKQTILQQVTPQEKNFS